MGFVRIKKISIYFAKAYNGVQVTESSLFHLTNKAIGLKSILHNQVNTLAIE